jgi:hypothetical protein
MDNLGTFTLVTGLLLLGGVALLGVSLAIYGRRQKFRARARRAEGLVVGSAGHAGFHSGMLKFPVVEFETESGRLVEFQSSVGSNPPMYRVGQRVSVLYDPDDPKQASIDSFVSRWLAILVPGCMGGIFLFLGGVFLLIALLVRLAST